MTGQPPHFLFVCDHGETGGPLGRVALLPWDPARPGWWPAEGEEAIRIWPMEGVKHGWNPAWLTEDPGSDDPRRFAIEILCPEPRCRSGYRSDDDKLQTLLAAIIATIATDETFRHAIILSADESLIMMKLSALHLAHTYAEKRLGLLV